MKRKEADMGRMIGYMITWTTYGTWLQGDERGFVKDGQVLEPSQNLERVNRQCLKKKPVGLSKRQKDIVRDAIVGQAEELGQKIYALAVCSDHVHVVVGCIDERMDKVVGRYKRAATVALRGQGFAGAVWTRGYDKRYCFDEQALMNRIKYVLRHEAE